MSEVNAGSNLATRAEGVTGNNREEEEEEEELQSFMQATAPSERTNIYPATQVGNPITAASVHSGSNDDALDGFEIPFVNGSPERMGIVKTTSRIVSAPDSAADDEGASLLFGQMDATTRVLPDDSDAAADHEAYTLWRIRCKRRKQLKLKRDEPLARQT